MFSPYKSPAAGKKAVTSKKIKEVYYITHIDNLESIMKIGIQSRNRAIETGVLHSQHDISNPDVQALREKKLIRSPYDGRSLPLHNYVNLYPQPFNAMMAALRCAKKDMKLCVLRVSNDILNIYGTLITNMNAACANMKPSKPTDWTLTEREFEAVRSRFITGVQTESDESILETFKRTRQFEVLVLNCVPSRYINGIFVPNAELKQQVESLTGGELPVDVNKSLFLRDDYSRELQIFKPLPQKRAREDSKKINAFELMMAPQQKKSRSI